MSKETIYCYCKIDGALYSVDNVNYHNGDVERQVRHTLNGFSTVYSQRYFNDIFVEVSDMDKFEVIDIINKRDSKTYSDETHTKYIGKIVYSAYDLSIGRNLYFVPQDGMSLGIISTAITDITEMKDNIIKVETANSLYLLRKV